MYALTAAQSRELDRLAIDKLGLAEEALMEAAGLSVVQAMEREWGSLTGRRVALLCGKGRNGGDALVAARYLLNQGAAALCCVAVPRAALSPQAARQASILENLGLRIAYLEGEEGLKLGRAIFESAELAVDGLFGTGFRGPAQGWEAQLIEALHAAGRPVVAVDLPSGLDADSGRAEGPCVKAALTVTFGAVKRGLLFEPGRTLAGKLVLADIGIPQSLLNDIQGKAEVLLASEAKALLPIRLPTAHKKSAGTLLIVAGSEDYPGAAILCARAALRSGCGFVRLLSARAILPLLRQAVPEAVCAEASLQAVRSLAGDCHAAVVGPGLSRAPEALKLARALFEELPLPAVFDADALRALDGAAAPKAERLLTPHEGEMAALEQGAAASADRAARAASFAAARGVHLLLKGPGTVLASPQGRLCINSTGSQVLATAGSGDVLAGICGALLAQGLPAFEAGALAVHLQGLSADLWVSRRGWTGLTAGDLAEGLPEAFSQLRAQA